MTAPSTIAEILSGPHLRELIDEGDGWRAVICVPLQFFRVVYSGSRRLPGRERIADRPTYPTSERVADMPVRT